LPALVSRHPTASFVVLTFLFSYSVGLTTLWLASAWLRPGADMAAQYLGRAGVVFGPAFAALVVTRSTAGWDSVVQLLSRLRPRREDLRWFALLPPLTLALTLLAYIVTGTPAVALASTLTERWPVLLAHGSLQLFIVGIGEELGWRGWLLPRLLLGRSRTAATLGVATIWCSWHLPVLLRGGWTAVAFAVGVFALSFLFTALWSSTQGSVLVVALGHAAHNAPFVFFENALGPQLAGDAWLMSCGIYACLAVGLVLLTRPWWRVRDDQRSIRPTPK
jgi:uncharacterized protein